MVWLLLLFVQLAGARGAAAAAHACCGSAVAGGTADVAVAFAAACYRASDEAVAKPGGRRACVVCA